DALTAAVPNDLGSYIEKKVIGAPLFGYTKNKQYKDQLTNHSSNRMRVWRND
ncbi:hypothetical protein FOPG_19912, partial [Fusarium oxysporum f. sp. conglutinans race 2 54008]